MTNLSRSRHRTRTALTTTALTGLLACSSAGIASAQEPTPIDPTQGRGTLGQITGPLICDPPGSAFRVTSECEVDHDNNVETPTINPYTRTAESPGLLGTAGLGALAPLGLNELL